MPPTLSASADTRSVRRSRRTGSFELTEAARPPKARSALQLLLASAGAEGWELVSATALFKVLMTKMVYILFLTSRVVVDQS
jgi:hypothetical protein